MRFKIACTPFSSCPASVAAAVVLDAPSWANDSSSAAWPRFRPDSSADSIFTSNHESIECDTNSTETKKITTPGKMPMPANRNTRRAIRREPNLPLLYREYRRARATITSSISAAATAAFSPSSQE